MKASLLLRLKKKIIFLIQGNVFLILGSFALGGIVLDSNVHREVRDAVYRKIGVDLRTVSPPNSTHALIEIWNSAIDNSH